MVTQISVCVLLSAFIKGQHSHLECAEKLHKHLAVPIHKNLHMLIIFEKYTSVFTIFISEM